MKLRMCGAVLVCVVILASVIACSSGASKAPNGMTASEILARYQNASASINTLQMDMTMHMGAMGDELNMSASISEDKPNRKVYAAETSPMFTGEIEVYVLDSEMYMSNPMAKAKWVKTPLTEDLFRQALDFGVNQELIVLNNCTNAQYIGRETIGGTDCYKITVNPNPAALLSAFNVSGLGNVSPSDAVKSSSCTVWVDGSTYYLLKMSCGMTLKFEASTGLLNSVFTTSNINQPVNIVLPAEAQNATALTNAQFESGNW
jgi:hypothetical protein